MDLKRLRRLAREVDDQHRAAMREIHDELDSSAPTDPTDPGGHDGRRAFLRGVGLGGAALTVGGSAVALAASGAGAQTTTTAGDTTTTEPATTTTEVPKAPTAEDLEILRCLVGSEMCIRDRVSSGPRRKLLGVVVGPWAAQL